MFNNNVINDCELLNYLNKAIAWFEPAIFSCYTIRVYGTYISHTSCSLQAETQSTIPASVQFNGEDLNLKKKQIANRSRSTL